MGAVRTFGACCSQWETETTPGRNRKDQKLTFQTWILALFKQTKSPTILSHTLLEPILTEWISMEPPLVNDATFSSANPSLSEIWPSQFPSSNKRPSSLLLHNHSSNSNKHVKLSPSSETHQNAALRPLQPDATSVAAANSSPLQTPKPKQDYIHVRARRGQATDSHSLAERVIHIIIIIIIFNF